MKYFTNFIGHKKITPNKDKIIEIKDFDNNIIAKVPEISSWELIRTFHAARKGKQNVQKIGIKDMFNIFSKASDNYRLNDKYDKFICLSRGNPISKVIESRNIISELLKNFQSILDENFFAKRFNGTIDRKRYHINYSPVGIVGLISSSTTREVTPYAALHALAMRNSLIIKAESKEPFSSLELAENLINSGVPQDSISVITANINNMPDLGYKLHKNTNRLIIFGSDENIRKISYYGIKDHIDTDELSKLPLPKDIISYGTGRSKSIVDKSTELNNVAKQIMQSAVELPSLCLKSQFAIVDQSIYDSFLDECCNIAKNMKKGSLLDKKTKVGHVHPEYIPVANSMIQNAIKLGGEIASGGLIKNPQTDPIIIKELPLESSLFREECYAPVLGVISSKSFKNTIEMLNKSVEHTTDKSSLKISYFGESIENFNKLIHEAKGIEFSNNKKTTDVNPIIPHQGINLARELTIARMID